MKEKLLKIINNYGVMKQLKYFQSEVFELNEAVITRETEFKDGEIQDIKPFDDHIAEEIADVEVMLLQFKEYYQIQDDDIKKIMNEKIDRQLARIEKEDE